MIVQELMGLLTITGLWMVKTLDNSIFFILQNDNVRTFFYEDTLRKSFQTQRRLVF